MHNIWEHHSALLKITSYYSIKCRSCLLIELNSMNQHCIILLNYDINGLENNESYQNVSTIDPETGKLWIPRSK